MHAHKSLEQQSVILLFANEQPGDLYQVVVVNVSRIFFCEFL